MAFDMTIVDSGRQDAIEDDEEFFFRLIEVHDLNCPILDGIWERFYEGPRIYADHSRTILAELDRIDGFLSESKTRAVDIEIWKGLHTRLRDFFGEASSIGSAIKCMSD